MTTTQSQVHALFPTPVGSYSGFAQQDALQEKLLGLLTTDKARNNSQDLQLRHWFDSNGGGILENEEPLLQDLKLGFSIALFLSCRGSRACNVTPCR